jgi:hypothetical protein
MKLAEFITTEVHESPIDMFCQANPSHVMRRYVKVEVKKTVIVETPRDGGIPYEVSATLSVCKLCYNEFVYKQIEAQRELSR